MRATIKFQLIIFVLLTVALNLAGQRPIKIDLTKATEKDLLMSDVFKKVEYIPLETTSECLLKNPVIYVTEKYIITTDFLHSAYLFNRKDGKFIREISRKGQGPNEYSFRIIEKYGFNEQENILFADNINKWKGIDIETNKVVLSVVKPEYKHAKQKKYEAIRNPWKISKNEFIGYTNNATGKCPYKLVVFDENGIVKKEYPNNLFYKKSTIDSPYNTGIFYKYEDKLYFKELDGNDTIFQITPERLIPHIIFELGENKVSYEKSKTETEKINGIPISYINNEGKYSIYFPCETNRHIFFNCFINGKYGPKGSFPGYYDKIKKQTYSARNSKIQAFINDKDEYFDFYPQTMNMKGELAGSIEPEKLIEYYTTHDKNKLSSKGKDILSIIKEDDNPIVVIATPF